MSINLEKKESTAVQAHINMMQGVINRMASNSANCKTWAVTIISAILVLYTDDKIAKENLWICYIPVILFFFLDCFYLGLERKFIKRQSKFVAAINNGEDFENDIFFVKKSVANKWYCKIWESVKNFFQQLLDTFCGIFSFSTLPFYGAILVFIYYLGMP